MTSDSQGAEGGFTLVELLIVMVILPLIVAAIAVAIISTERNAGATSARLSDSANAQITSEYYIPDIQSAQVSATITPTQFGQAAGAGWTPVTATTTVAPVLPATAVTIPTSGTFSLPVTSTSGFDLSQPIVVTTSGGFVSVTCTGYQPLS